MEGIPEGTIIGPVLEVHIVKILDGYGIEIAIPSLVKPANTFYALLSLETKRFANENHDHKEELRSSNELLTAERGSNRNKETCANPPSNPMGDSWFKETFIPRGKRKWITIDANPSPRSGLPTKASKMVTKMVRHHDQDEREQDGSCHWKTVKWVLLKVFAQEGAE